ncbi:probable helicase senataxin [Centruroides vittatus]|uniref:probable helicase senataxin n=1 Tax=Centruroides vittatus TaxID=120091 RepID=UPI00350F74F3
MTTLDDVITKILQWNTNWLLEQKDNLSPPPIVDQSSLRKVALCYNSKQEYFNTYINLLLLEIWNCMFRSWQITLEKKSKSTYVAVVDTKTYMDTMIINCQTVISPKIPFDKESYPFEGNIVVVDLRIQNVENAVIKVFGYISEHKQENYKPHNGTVVSSLLTTLPACKEENIQLISFVVKMKLRDKNLDLSKLMKIEMISYIKPLLRHCEALFNFTQSNLHHHILKPNYSICSYEEISEIDFTLKENYNATQILAISRICKSIRQSQSLSKIHLLDGPPGTGKTYTAVGIIRQLLCQKDREHCVKLLVTAPSNVAVDEIGIQLLKMKSQLKKPDGKNVRFVRIGQGDQVHRDLKFYFIEELVKYNLKELQKDLDQMNINELQIKIARLKMEIQREKVNNNSRQSIEVKESQLENYYQKFELYQNRNDINKCKQKLRMEILTKADIILSTLNGCRNTALENAYGKNSSVTFTCCIVDEAAQCTEPEVLIPLQYGINKLVLIGDPEQLPASVTSKIGIQYGLQLSLFERFQRYFLQAEEPNPILCLTENYRMHSETCSFVSENFSCSLSPLNSKVNHFNFPLKPYVLLDILSDHEFRTSNMAEVAFVGKLCIELLKILPSSSSVGVITFHQTHKHAFNQYFDSIDDWRNKNQYKVEVNIVDSFQGREKDVIILYCAGANNSSNVGYLNDKQRLKVAFTRVRYSLILCCDVAFLKKHSYWNGLLSHAKRRNVSFQVKSITDVIKKITK